MFKALKKNLSVADMWVCIGLLFFLWARLNYEDLGAVGGDIGFHYNRFLYFQTELMSGRLPFYYNYTLAGFGYGSSFFYGHWLFYLILPFEYLFGYKGFVGFHFVIYLFGGYFFNRKLMRVLHVKEERFASFLLALGPYFMWCFGYCCMLPCMVAQVLGILFLAYCVEFFRDKKNCWKPAIIFFIICGTHTIMAVLLTVASILVCIYYFDKKRLKDYIKFAIAHALVALYFGLNLLYHYDSHFAVNKISANIGQWLDRTLVWNMSPSVVLFFSGSTYCVPFFDILTLVLLVVLVVKRYKSKEPIKLKERVLFYACLLISILSTLYIFGYYFGGWFVGQFSFRFMTYVIIFFVVFALRKQIVGTKWKVIVGIGCVAYSFFILCTLQLKQADLGWSFNEIANGEYLDESCYNQTELGEYVNKLINKVEVNGEFVKPYHIDYGLVFTNDNKGLVERVDNLKQGNGYSTGVLEVYDTFASGDIVVFPKFYYRGYECTAISERSLETIQVPVTKSAHGMCQIEIPSGFEAKELRLYYSHPWFLILVDIISNGVFILYIVLAIIDGGRKKRTLQGGVQNDLKRVVNGEVGD